MYNMLRRCAALVVAAVAIPVPSAVPVFTAALSSSTGPASAAPHGVAGGDRVFSLTVGGRARSYRLFVPTSVPSSPKLVVALHPFDGMAATFERTTNLDAGAVTTGTLVAYPTGINASWNAGRCCGRAQATGVDDVGFLDAVIDDVEARYPVDQAHVAVGGFSNGALMSYRYLCERSSRVHTAFVGSGALVVPSCTFSQPIQVLHMHGVADTTVPLAGTPTTPDPVYGALPSVKTTANAVAAAAGCSTTWIGSTVNRLTKKYVARDCPAKSSISVYQSSTLMHGWVTGPTADARYGINETSLVWSFLVGTWSAT